MTPSLRILLLDDDSFMLAILAEMLADLGQGDVVLADNAGEALSLLRHGAPALLICDLAMPDMDGLAFLSLAAEHGFRGAVALLSGMDGATRAEAERLAAASGLRLLGAWQKPIAAAELARLLALAGPGAPGTSMTHQPEQTMRDKP